MYGHGPISGSPYSSLLRIPAPDPPYLFCNERWSSIGLSLQETPAWEQWDSAGVGSDVQLSTQRWRTSGLIFSTLDFVERWITSSVGGELVFDERWSTFVPEVKETPADSRFAVTGITIQELPAWARWATDGAPINITVADESWATAAPVLQALDAWEQWVTRAPELAYLVGDEQWETAVPQLAILTFEERWFFNYMVRRALEVVYPSQVRRALEVPYEIGTTRVRRALEVPIPLLTRVRRACVIDYPIQAFDQVRRALEVRYPILDGSVIVAIAAPTLEVRERTLVIEDFDITGEERQLWKCNVTLPDPADLALFGAKEPFTITLGGEAFSFIRDEARHARSGPVGVDATVSGISPAAVYAEPHAEKVTKTWQTATLVSAVLEELFGAGVVELRGVIDWAIPAGRLSVTGQTPMDIGSMPARAPGGVLEADPDGALYIRPLWPVSVPFLADATPDHLYDDARDAFTLEERIGDARIANRIRVLDAADVAGALLLAEIDPREDGLNKGRTRFLPGDQPAILIYTGPRVELDAVRSSAGHISTLSPGTREIEEESLSFTDTTEATLQYPTAALSVWKWLGNDLGTPELVDELTVRIPAPGLGKLLVTYETAFEARRLSGVPVKLAGEDEYDVLVLVEGSQH